MQTDVKRLRPLGDIVLTRVKFILTKFFSWNSSFKNLEI